MGLLDGTHARALSDAQALWDRGHQAEAVGALEAVQADLSPQIFATDAHIVATLAGFVCDSGDPHRGLKMLEALRVTEHPTTDVQSLALGVRARCRAVAGDLMGAQADRGALSKAHPGHPALHAADDAILEYKRSIMSRTTITRSSRDES